MSEMRDPAVHEARPALITRDFILLFIAHLLFGLSFWPYVLLPVFLQQWGADLFTIGVMMATASLSGILVRPWVGAGLDRVGRKKLLIIGGALFTTANLSYLAIHAVGIGIYLVRLLHGLGMGILMATLFTLAADFSPATRRTEGIALFGVAGHLSGAIGVLMGEQIVRLGGYPALFISSTLLSVLTMAISFLIREPQIEDSPPQAAGNLRPEWRRYLFVFARLIPPQGVGNTTRVRVQPHPIQSSGFFQISLRPALRLPIFGTVAFGLSMTSYMVFLKPYAVAVGIDSITPFFVAYTLTAVGVRLVGSRWPDRFGLKPVLYPAMVSLSIGILNLLLLRSIGGLIVSGALCGMGHGFIFPILSVMLIQRETEENRGSVVTLFTLLYDSGLLIGAPLLGFIARGNRYMPMFIFAALIQAASLTAFILLDREEGAARRSVQQEISRKLRDKL
jgi:MFS family permease